MLSKDIDGHSSMPTDISGTFGVTLDSASDHFGVALETVGPFKESLGTLLGITTVSLHLRFVI